MQFGQRAGTLGAQSDQGFDPEGKGQAALGLSVVCAAGAAGVFAGFFSAVLLAPFVAGAAFFATGFAAALATGFAAALAAGFAAALATGFAAALAAGFAAALAAGFAAALTAGFTSGLAAGFFAVAISISLINLQRALDEKHSCVKRCMVLGRFPAP
ncbi:MAG: hypothetical protein A2503_13955 [Burkholderiales bacterium RIFOXYD12_FULL_59_19]|nr:MAG: hypothetical protein A2503_13955 [Burkholderiales bacterium RIFOXYD12_FULL_59_19]